MIEYDGIGKIIRGIWSFKHGEDGMYFCDILPDKLIALCN